MSSPHRGRPPHGRAAPAVRGPEETPVSVAVELAPVTTRFDTIDASDVLAEALDEHRRALNGYCYRMLGSAFEADDAVQETMVRAWRA
ncbi:MAG TPA: sigma factor, partial [Acidimicrobiales bacterium]